MNKPRIIFVSDSAADQSLVDALGQNGFDVSFTATSVDASPGLFGLPPDLLVLDISDVPHALAFLKTVRTSSHLKQTPVLVIAEWGSGQPTLALANGADAIEPKPIGAQRMLAAVTRLLQSKMVLTASAGTNGDED